MANYKRAVAMAVTLCGLGFTAAQAETVTFDDISVGSGGYNQYGNNAIISSDGFNFMLTGTPVNYVVNTQICGPSCPVDGTNIVLMPYGTSYSGQSSVTMTKIGGGSFNLYGFDGSGSFNFNEQNLPNYIPNQIDVVGFLANGTQANQSFLIDKSAQSGPLAFTSYLFNESFVNLASVSFSSSGSQSNIYNGFSIDNISTSAVPEPASIALFGLGLLGFSVSRRREKSRNM